MTQQPLYDPLFARVHDAIHRHFPGTLKLLQAVVNTDSYSRDPEGVNRVHALLIPHLERLGFHVEVRDQTGFGSHVIARLPGPRPGYVLMLGHVDTPHPPGTASRRPFTVRNGRGWGPGVSDMKGGVVAMVAAMQALLESGWDERPTVEILLTPDEEIGSPSSRALIEERARKATAVFNLESGRPDGSVVIARRGSAHLEIHIQGRAAHAGVNLQDGISAVEELAHKIIALHRLTNLDEGVTVNVGVVQGGTNTNVVAAEAMARVHGSFPTVTHGEALLAAIRRIVEEPYVTGTKATLSGGITFLPLEPDEGVQALFAIAQEAARDMGFELKGTYTLGAADAGFAQAAGAPVLCGMGPVGGGWHGEDEYLELDTYPRRIELLARCLVLAPDRLPPRDKK